MGRPVDPAGASLREDLGIDHWTRSVPLGALFGAFCISKGYYQIDAETLVVVATGLFGFGLYSNVADIVRRDIHASEAAQWA
jgi:hypothetical protein